MSYWLLQRHGSYQTVGLIDFFQPAGSRVHGPPILCGVEDFPHLYELHVLHHLVVAIGDNHKRKAMAQRLQQQLPEAVVLEVQSLRL